MEKEEFEEVPEEENIDVVFRIKGYNDIFSDFDPRPSSVRGLSEDFLSEARRAVVSRESEKIKFIITMPKNERDRNEESIITGRLKRYFRNLHNDLLTEKKKIFRRGILFAIAGVVLMMAATLIVFEVKNPTILTSFMTILLEPGGWFLFWQGLDLMIFEYERSNPPIDFSRRMSKAEIIFASA